MNKILAISFLLISFGVATSAQTRDKIELVEHSKGGLPIMQALQMRESSTSFTDKELELQDLSDLLWAACGINRPDNGKRTAPSSQNTQDIDIYVCLAEGVYRYNPQDNILSLVNSGDFRMLAEPKSSTKAAPCLLLIVADKSRYAARNSEQHVHNMVYVDAGIVSQNIGLFCAGVGLATKPRAQMNQEELRKALKLTDTQVLILNQPVGYPQ